MAKYVDTDTIVEKLWPVDPENDGSDGCTVVLQNLTFTSADLESLLDEIPAADVAPVVHARWIRGVPGDNEPRCSNCLGYQPWFFGYGYYDPDHCPHCGAIMDLREQVDENEQDL